MKSAELLREREQRRRAYYREAILRAAERVIVRKGYSATTMDDVAREARLSKATLYKYVPGKGVLLFEILHHYLDDLRAKTEAVAAGPGTAADRLRSVILLALRESESKQSLNRVLWTDKSMLKLMRLFAAAAGKSGSAASADRKRLNALFEKRQALTAVGARILTDGVSSGEFRPLDAGQAAEFVGAVIEGYTHVRFWRGGGLDPEKVAGELTRFVIEGIRNPERVPKEN
jgi:AcrR family transcriptional regulator